MPEPLNLVVTGGSRGIGRAVVEGAAARGWRVTFSFRADSEAAEALARATGARAVRAETTSEADTAALFDAAGTDGPITGLVTSAGIVAPGSRLADMDVERMRRVLEVNCLGTLIAAREGARRMRGGSVVLLSSAAARLGGPGEFVDYAASKGAIDTLCTGLARELAPQIRVNAVRPGIIATDMNDGDAAGGRADRLGPLSPLARAGRAEEVAGAVLWLLSDAASYVTGAHLDVSGGR